MTDLCRKKIHVVFLLKRSMSMKNQKFCKLRYLVRNSALCQFHAMMTSGGVNQRPRGNRHFFCQSGRNNQQESTIRLLQVAGMRTAYKGKNDVFDFEHLASKEPFGQFAAWFQEAKQTAAIMEANAMALATTTREGIPSVRMVLMKGIDEQGIVFYTNYLSRKGQELTDNPHCSLMFYWEPLMKSVRIEGKVQRVSEEESAKYFHSRPRSSQLGACVSVKQSSQVESREVLDKRNADLHALHADETVPIPKPHYWGGFRVIPHRFEFWQGQTNRIHDRIVFRQPDQGETINPSVTYQGEKGWVLERLMP